MSNPRCSSPLITTMTKISKPDSQVGTEVGEAAIVGVRRENPEFLSYWVAQS